MADENNTPANDCRDIKYSRRRGGGGTGIAGSAYFMAFIGAAVYFIMQATTFWGGVLGFLKAIVWPTMLVFKLFEFLKV